MTTRARVILTPFVFISDDDETVFCGRISRNRYFAVTQYRKRTFLDGGFSVWIGTGRKMTRTRVKHEDFRRGEPCWLTLVTERGVFTLTKNAESGRWDGKFRGRKIEVSYAP